MRLRNLLCLVLPSMFLHAWTPNDMLKVKAVGNVQVSPDSRYVAFTVTRQLLEQPEPNSQIRLVREDGSHPCQLTRGDRSCTIPRW